MAAGASAYTSDDEATMTTHIPMCTATSSTGSGAYFDLRPDIALNPETSSGKSGNHKDYHARGYDYGKNFTINICSSVVEPVKDVVGVGASDWANVSAYYVSNGNTYSIGSESMDLRSRGRKLVLQYANGSPCKDSEDLKRKLGDTSVYADADAPLVHHDAEGDTTAATYQNDDDTVRRKSTTISFLCDRDPGNIQTTIAFVGTDPDECAYFFEARSPHACASAEPHKPGSVGPGSVFGLIFIIAVLVYVLGGVFYNRTVAHARGWRQLPNYSLWAGIWNFITVRDTRLKPTFP
jgi:cation-dependent mannose-6-phosphate receptor